MAKQDDYVRITIRIPKDVHADLTELAGPRSLNAEIVERLIDSVGAEKRAKFINQFANSDVDSSAAPGKAPVDKIAALLARIEKDSAHLNVLYRLGIMKNKKTKKSGGSD